MKKHIHFMKSLSGRQFQTQETYLTCFSSKKEPHEKILRLASLLRNADEEMDAEKISAKLYWGEENPKKALHLAQRLRNKTLECMLMDSQLRDNRFIAGYEKAVIKAHKKFAGYRLLGIGHTPVEIKEDLLNELIRTCKKQEFYPLLLSCLEQKRWTEGLRNGMKIMIGGGQVDEAVRVYTGADAYGSNAVAAVTLCRQWIPA